MKIKHLLGQVPTYRLDEIAHDSQIRQFFNHVPRVCFSAAAKEGLRIIKI